MTEEEKRHYQKVCYHEYKEYQTVWIPDIKRFDQQLRCIHCGYISHGYMMVSGEEEDE